MQLKDVLQQCPKARERFHTFAGQVLSGLYQLHKQSDPEVQQFELDPESAAQYASILLEYNTRTLYEFFDHHEIRIGIEPISVNEQFFFIHNINEYMREENRERFSVRVEAEQAAFVEAFKLLEEKLS